MSMKAFAVTCDKYYPGIVAHYAAETPDQAKYEALISMRKIGGRAKLSDLDCERAPEYDGLALSMRSRGAIPERFEKVAEA